MTTRISERAAAERREALVRGALEKLAQEAAVRTARAPKGDLPVAAVVLD